VVLKHLQKLGWSSYSDYRTDDSTRTAWGAGCIREGSCRRFAAMPRQLAALLVMALVACVCMRASATDSIAGHWTLTDAGSPGALHLVLYSEDRNGHEVFSNGHDIDASALSPVPELGSMGPLRFTLAREAGTFVFTGAASGRTGSGTFEFSPNAAFTETLRKQGITVNGQREVLAAAGTDLTVEYARAIASSGYQALSLHQLVVFRSLGISPEWFNDEQRAFGAIVPAVDVGAIWALKISPEYVERLRSLGVTSLTPRDTIRLKSIGVNAEFIDGLRSRGMRNLTVAQIVALRTRKN
jgi:hypothetical protein